MSTPRKEGQSPVQVNFGSVEEMNMIGIQNYPLRLVNDNMHQKIFITIIFMN
jgi:hypothetical protein